MTQWHAQSKKKPTGGILRTKRRCNKKLSWKGGIFAATSLSEKPKIDTFNVRGGGSKSALLRTNNVNLVVPGKKTGRAEILAVVENAADRHYARRRIITKGAVIKVTANGSEKYASVTSAPGQSGSVDAVLLENYVEKKGKSTKKAAAQKDGGKTKKPEKTPQKAKETETGVSNKETKTGVSKAESPKPKE